MTNFSFILSANRTVILSASEETYDKWARSFTLFRMTNFSVILSANRTVILSVSEESYR